LGSIHTLFKRAVAEVDFFKVRRQSLNSTTRREVRMSLQQVKSVIAIAAGKGGVGKSTLTVTLALALQQLGFKVGILDADVYGPSLKKMLPCQELPRQHPEREQRIVPALCSEIKVISVDYFRKEGEATVVRAPLANSIISQFLTLVEWEALDYLLIDFPPGTGDIQLTLMQQAVLSGALIITTPQEIALLDVRKCMQMFQAMRIPIFGVVENMSYFRADKKDYYLFGSGGGKRLSEEMGVPFLGEIPIDPELSAHLDKGISLFSSLSESPAVRSVLALAEQLQDRQKERWDSAPESGAVNIAQRDPFSLTIEWEDGSVSTHLLRDLQKRCPCVRCQEKKREIDDEVEAYSFERVGHFALKIHFKSGCSYGIYPFSLVRAS
jgi:ATP-binding protein involved in chromosome partitioning